MRNIFVALDYETLVKFDSSWENQISNFFCSPNTETPSQTFWRLILNSLKEKRIDKQTILLEKLAHSLLMLFLKGNYITSSEYARLTLPIKTSWPIGFQNILDIFSPSTNYINELIDFLMLSYNYSSTITDKLHTTSTNTALSKYQKTLRTKETIKENSNVLTAEDAAGNIFYGALARIKKHDPNILSPFITPSKNSEIAIDLESPLDIEILSNLLRYSDGSKNPFIVNDKKVFKMENFLNALEKISFDNVFLEDCNISKSRIICHNHYIFERMTNVNYLFNLFALHKYINIHYDDNPATLSSLFNELKNWICFPLLTTRLRVLNSILNSTNQLDLLTAKEKNFLINILKAIRIYHVCFLLPILVKVFHYIVNALREGEISNTDVVKEVLTLFYQNKILQQEKLKPEDINKSLEQYFSSSSVKQRLLYFDPSKDSLTPVMSYYSKIIPIFNLSRWNKKEAKGFNLWSHNLLCKRFIKGAHDIINNIKTQITFGSTLQVAPLVFYNIYEKNYLISPYSRGPIHEPIKTTVYQQRDCESQQCINKQSKKSINTPSKR